MDHQIRNESEVLILIAQEQTLQTNCFKSIVEKNVDGEACI